MSARPSRAKMCSWLAKELGAASRIIPSNPMDTKALVQNARASEIAVERLSRIAAELGWHVEASLDDAWALIQEYDRDKSTTPTVTEEIQR